MRVLTVGNMYPPHHFGGYEQVWASAVNHLRRRGHDVRVLAADYRHPDEGERDEPEVTRTLRWYWKDHDFAPLPYYERLKVERHNRRELISQLRELEPDVVSFWSMGGMSHSLIEQVRRRRLPIVCFAHDGWLDYGRVTDQWTRMFLWQFRPAAPLIDALTGIPTIVRYGAAGRYVFVSDFLRRAALTLGLNLTDTAVAHSGIAPLFAPRQSPREWGWRLLYIGRMHPDKGIEDAVRCLKLLPEQSTLTFAGSWDPRDELILAELVGELGLEPRVTMLGRLPPEDIAELYRDSDVLLFPVRWDEPWGLVPLEAMASGCPVVATGRGGSGEYLRDGENCVLVAPADPSALAEAVRRLADSRPLRDTVRAGGLQTASRYTEEAFNRSVERHLEEVSGRSSTGLSGAAGENRASQPGAGEVGARSAVAQEPPAQDEKRGDGNHPHPDHHHVVDHRDAELVPRSEVEQQRGHDQHQLRGQDRSQVAGHHEERQAPDQVLKEEVHAERVDREP
jgi:glycosyltransferase involved in cell wall biosynthesis